MHTGNPDFTIPASKPSLEQKEKRRHGEITFPIEKYGTRLAGDYPFVPPHWHEEAEFTLIQKGKCTYQIQLQSFEVAEGDLIFVPPMLLHSISVSDNMAPAEVYSDTFVFHMHFLGAGAGDICGIRYLTPLMNQTLLPPFILSREHPIYEKALELFLEIDHAWNMRMTGYELIIKAALLRLLALLLPYCIESSKVPPIQTEHALKLKNALDYISSHYTENISISDVAEACYFSEYHFMRFFKKYVGMSCFDYLKNYRLEKAAELLQDGELSILDVCLSSGFHNLSYFYREFKEKYGMTPKEWRKIRC